MPVFQLIFKILAGAILILLGLLGVSYMQSRFDHADEKKAVAAIVTKFPEVSPENCFTVIESRASGRIQVNCGAHQHWVVDVLRGTIEVVVP